MRHRLKVLVPRTDNLHTKPYSIISNATVNVWQNTNYIIYILIRFRSCIFWSTINCGAQGTPINSIYPLKGTNWSGERREGGSAIIAPNSVNEALTNCMQYTIIPLLINHPTCFGWILWFAGKIYIDEYDQQCDEGVQKIVQFAVSSVFLCGFIESRNSNDTYVILFIFLYRCLANELKHFFNTILYPNI